MLNSDKIKEAMRTPRFIKMVARYQFLMDNLYSVDVSNHADFQRTYNCFFQLRRNERYRTQHFNFLEDHKANKQMAFQQILRFLSSVSDTVEASFASKMLSIINPDMPVLDSKVLNKLKIKKPPGSSQQGVVGIYSEICDWYDGFKKTQAYTEWIDLFNEHFPNSGISPAKKIDFILWQLD